MVVTAGAVISKKNYYIWLFDLPRSFFFTLQLVQRLCGSEEKDPTAYGPLLSVGCDVFYNKVAM